jgi:hypothetical protein
MKFTMESKRVPQFNKALFEMTSELKMDFPKAGKFESNEVLGYTTIILSEAFIYTLNKLNPNLVELLMNIK